MATIPARERQQLLESLGRMLGAGLPAARAAATLAPASGPARTATRTLRMQLEDGRSVAAALRRAKLISPLETLQLEHAEQAGRVDTALSRMADQDAARITRARQLRNKLIAPGAILVVALLASPLPKLVAGTLTWAGYALRAVLPLAVIAALAVVIRRLLPRAGQRFHEALPVVGPLLRRRARLESLVSLHGLLDAGVPAIDALAAMAPESDQMTFAHGELRGGASVAAALRDAGVIDGQGGYARVDSGEHAGRLVEALARHVAEAEADQAGREALLAEWVPRLVYVAAAGFAAWTMVSGRL